MDYRADAYRGVAFDYRPVQYYRASGYEGPVVQYRARHMGSRPDHHVVAYGSCEVAGAPAGGSHYGILHYHYAFAYPYRRPFGGEDSAIEHARIRADGDVAGDYRVRRYIGSWVNI